MRGAGPDAQRRTDSGAAGTARAVDPGGNLFHRRHAQHELRDRSRSTISICCPTRIVANSSRSRRILEEACERNAHERCRRFQSAPLSLSFTGARQHVEGRAEDLAQVRPEWGHATNAICIVGRRERTRGLFLDRRAFLTSYDPTQDDAEYTILTRILQAVFPVCAGINLEYYFSYVDNIGWGSGTKLPHNVAALLGVMDGAASDLRTGLPWQMVEIHEPVRSLFIIETTPEAMLQIMDRNRGIGKLCRNRWVRLAVLDPATRVSFSVFQAGEFRPYQPQAGSCPRRLRRWTGIAAGAITWSSRRSRVRFDHALWTKVTPCSHWNMC